MNKAELVKRLVAVADDVGLVAAPLEVSTHLTRVCIATRLALGAVAVSVSRIEGDSLVFLASDGPGADRIIGTRLPLGRGIAGLVALTGQSLAIERPVGDPRFAREVAESTGYVPQAILALPITGDGEDPLGVMSILDRGAAGGADVFAVASAMADLAVPWLKAADVTIRIAPLLLRALAGAVSDDVELAVALQREAAAAEAPADRELAELTALLAAARSAGPAASDAASRILREFLTFSKSRRAR